MLDLMEIHTGLVAIASFLRADRALQPQWLRVMNSMEKSLAQCQASGTQLRNMVQSISQRCDLGFRIVQGHEMS